MSPAEAFNTRPRSSQSVVLVVDDESGIRDFLSAFLQSKDFKVFTAGSADEALEIWPEIKPKVSLLITDIIMPGMNGKQLAERFLAEKPSLKVIFMSGYLPEEMEEESLGALFFRKPFHPRELLNVIRQALH